MTPMWGNRASVTTYNRGEFALFRLPPVDGSYPLIEIDRRNNRVSVKGSDKVVRPWMQLLSAIDTPRRRNGRQMVLTHGDNGDGRGPAGIGLRPPPRDFTNPVFKFGGVAAGELPPDSEMLRVVKNGLAGTAMLLPVSLNWPSNSNSALLSAVSV